MSTFEKYKEIVFNKMQDVELYDGSGNVYTFHNCQISEYSNELILRFIIEKNVIPVRALYYLVGLSDIADKGIEESMDIVKEEIEKDNRKYKSPLYKALKQGHEGP